MPPVHSFGLDLSTLREGAYSKTPMRQFKRHFARFREKQIHMKVQVVVVRGSQFYPPSPGKHPALRLRRTLGLL